MLCSVTALGAQKGESPAGAAGKIVDYLRGKKADRGKPLQAPRAKPDPPTPELDRPGPGSSERMLHYFGDSAEGQGRWLGSGFGQTDLVGDVDGDQFAALLLGQDPVTGDRLTGGSGVTASAAGRVGDPKVLAGLGAGDVVGLATAAQYLGVSKTYLKDLAAKTAAKRSAGERPEGAFLDATKTGSRGAWQVRVGEVQRFESARVQKSVVLGYDVTFSCPKSVSLLWASCDRETRTEILESVEASVRAGIGYLEGSGCAVRIGGEVAPGEGLLAAGYLHATSRALDPQLHWHCVVLNATVGPDGLGRAVDGRALFTHVKTAGYLAGAQLRHELSARLGVAWEQPVNGLADIVGFDRATIEAFSKRSSEVGEVADAAGLTSAAGRQAAALSSRSAKQAVPTEELIDGWHAELAARGYVGRRLERMFRRQAPESVTVADIEHLYADLLGAGGLTEMSPAFDRRDVIHRVAEWSGHRLSSAEILDVADEVLDHPEVVRLDPDHARSGAVIRRGDGRVIAANSAATFTTVAMLELEAQILDRVHAGYAVGTGMVEAARVDAAIAGQPSLGADQAAMVRAICSSGDRVQCVLGPAGSGKTFALDIATRAWEAQGYRVTGAAVAGVAADVLGRAIGVETRTIASLLARLDSSDGVGVLDDRSVVLVDEASTLGTRDFARLIDWVDRTGATVRLVGDPAQHGAVTAGGMFAHLVAEHPERVPVLTQNRRQTGEDLTQVRLALGEYRHGQITDAIDRLHDDGRVVTAASADELLDRLVADWYLDRDLAQRDPNRPASAMIAEHHFERAQLNTRARALLAADGSLTGPALTAAGHEFQAGDDVIARQQDRTLRPAGADANGFVRNADRGTITAVDLTPNSDGVWVDFEHRGEVFVPRSFLEAEIRRGVNGGLTHAYALTSHAAQGETYSAGRHLATDRSSTEGVYVGLTRGRDDVRLYAVRHHDLAPRADDDPELPRLLAETRDVADSVRARLNTSSAERLALDHDTTALEIARLRQQHRPRQLHELARAEGPDSLAQRAWDHEKMALGRSACRRPDPQITNLLGPRPEPGASRVVWDHAVTEIAGYRATHLDHTTADARSDWSEVTTAIERARHYLEDRTIIDLRHDPAPVAAPEPLPEPNPTVASTSVARPVFELEL